MRPMNMARVTVVSAVLTALVLVGCSSPSQNASPTARQGRTTAMQTCRRALGQSVASASTTTVAEVRALTMGPNQHPARKAFPRSEGSAPAAWCWTGGSGNFVSYAATQDGQKFKLATFGGYSVTPSGPPVVP